ncbi:MAG: RHS repeat protein, partial [Clostridia bacterium]|nr:RHS repeat protein [Clostridia bacterium]
MSTNYVKNYNAGQIKIDLPTANYIHELPLLSFGDIYGNVNLSLVFNYGMKAEGSNPFNIAAGYKLNMQKKLMFATDNEVNGILDSNGNVVDFAAFGDVFTFEDESRRILRRTEQLPLNPVLDPILPYKVYDYEIEYPDYSKEAYDVAGRLISVHDKYNTQVFSYGYDSYGKLTSITYRGAKTVSFTYDTSDRLSSITYDSKTSTFEYTSTGIEIEHYSGVKFTLASSETGFSSIATDIVEPTSVSYKTEIIRSTEYSLTLTNYINGEQVDTAIYEYPIPITNCDTLHSRVEITDRNGITMRTQYDGKKPYHSYELMDKNDSPYENLFFDDADGKRIYKGTVYIDTEDFRGTLGVNDGIRMDRLSSDLIGWTHTYTEPGDLYGNFIITGWIYAPDDSTYTVTVTDIHNGRVYDGCTLTNLTQDEWNCFSFKTYIRDPNQIVVNVNKSSGLPLCYDVRIMFVEGKIFSSTGLNHFTVTKDVLIKEDIDPSKVKVIYLDDTVRFYNGNNLISQKITASDILRYKTNKNKNINTDEIYYDNCKGLITNSGLFVFEYDEEIDGSTQTTRVNVDSVAIGNSSIRNDKTYTTRMNFYTDSTGNTYFASKMYVNATEIRSEEYDENFDVVSSTIDGVTTNYTRTDGLITQEGVTGLYTRRAEYSTDSEGNPKIVKTDEFNNEVVYILDPVWGGVKSVTLPDSNETPEDNPKITDGYDTDMTDKLSRTFSDSTVSQANTLSYSGGNLTGLAKGALNYTFGYTKGNLTSVSKIGTEIENHTYEENDKKITSKYPSAENPIYTEVQNFDNYGRLIGIGGRIANTYDIAPSFIINSQTSAAEHRTVEIDNSAAVLSTSQDLIANETTHYGYEK